MNARKFFLILTSAIVFELTILMFLIQLEKIKIESLINLGFTMYAALLFVAIIYSLFYAYLLTIFRTAVDSDIDKIQKYYKLFKKDKNRFKGVFLEWRIHTEANKLEKINGGKLELLAHDRGKYLITIFHSLISRLTKGDEYLTLSNLTFWANASYDDFILENLQAVKRGVIINRIIVLDKSIFTNENFHLRRKLIDFCGRISHWKANEKYGSLFEKMDFKFFLCESPSLELKQSLPYAILRNKKQKKESMIVLPRFFRGSSKVDVMFEETSQNHVFNTYLNRFESIANHQDLLEVDGLLMKLDNQSRY